MITIKFPIYWGMIIALTVNSHCAEEDDEHAKNNSSSMQTIPKPEASEITIQAVPEPECTVRAWTEADQKNSDELNETRQQIQDLDKAFTYGSETPFVDAWYEKQLRDMQKDEK